MAEPTTVYPKELPRDTGPTTPRTCQHTLVQRPKAQQTQTQTQTQTQKQKSEQISAGTTQQQQEDRCASCAAILSDRNDPTWVCSVCGYLTCDSCYTVERTLPGSPAPTPTPTPHAVQLGPTDNVHVVIPLCAFQPAKSEPSAAEAARQYEPHSAEAVTDADADADAEHVEAEKKHIPSERVGTYKCGTCGTEVTVTCVAPSPRDRGFMVQCAKCSCEGRDVACHTADKTWAECVCTAIYNLSLDAENKAELDPEANSPQEVKAIVGWIHRNRGALFPQQQQQQQQKPVSEAVIRQSVLAALSDNSRALFRKTAIGHRATQWSVILEPPPTVEPTASTMVVDVVSEDDSAGTQQQQQPLQQSEQKKSLSPTSSSSVSLHSHRHKRPRRPASPMRREPRRASSSRQADGTADEAFEEEIDEALGKDSGESNDEAGRRSSSATAAAKGKDADEDSDYLEEDDEVDREEKVARASTAASSDNDDSGGEGKSDGDGGGESEDYDSSSSDSGSGRSSSGDAANAAKKPAKAAGKKNKSHSSHRFVASGPYTGDPFKGEMKEITDKRVVKYHVEYYVLTKTGEELWLDATQVKPGKILTNYEESLAETIGISGLNKSDVIDFAQRNCHQCHNKNFHFMTCAKCQRTFCANCLRRHEYDVEAVSAPNYRCALCRKICACAVCRRRRGEEVVPPEKSKGRERDRDAKERRRERDRERHLRERRASTATIISPPQTPTAALSAVGKSPSVRRSSSADEHKHTRSQDFESDTMISGWVTFQPPPRPDAIVVPVWRAINEEDGDPVAADAQPEGAELRTVELAEAAARDSDDDTSDERYARLHEKTRQFLFDAYNAALELSKKRKSKKTPSKDGNAPSTPNLAMTPPPMRSSLGAKRRRTGEPMSPLSTSPLPTSPAPPPPAPAAESTVVEPKPIPSLSALARQVHMKANGATAVPVSPKPKSITPTSTATPTTTTTDAKASEPTSTPTPSTKQRSTSPLPKQVEPPTPLSANKTHRRATSPRTRSAAAKAQSAATSTQTATATATTTMTASLTATAPSPALRTQSPLPQQQQPKVAEAKASSAVKIMITAGVTKAAPQAAAAVPKEVAQQVAAATIAAARRPAVALVHPGLPAAFLQPISQTPNVPVVAASAPTSTTLPSVAAQPRPHRKTFLDYPMPEATPSTHSSSAVPAPAPAPVTAPAPPAVGVAVSVTPPTVVHSSAPVSVSPTTVHIVPGKPAILSMPGQTLRQHSPFPTQPSLSPPPAPVPLQQPKPMQPLVTWPEPTRFAPAAAIPPISQYVAPVYGWQQPKPQSFSAAQLPPTQQYQVPQQLLVPPPSVPQPVVHVPESQQVPPLPFAVALAQYQNLLIQPAEQQLPQPQPQPQPQPISDPGESWMRSQVCTLCRNPVTRLCPSCKAPFCGPACYFRHYTENHPTNVPK